MTPLRGLTKLRSTLHASAAPPAAPGELTDAQRKATAAAIIRAGKIRRGEIADDSRPTDNTAAAIIRAGRIRRGEQP